MGIKTPDGGTNSAGFVQSFAGATAPTGWLLCDGSAVSRITYSTLFAAIGITHGQGDGSTTFNLPDYRGRFLRGVDGAANRDPDKAGRTAMATGGNTQNSVGSVQNDAFQGHYHTTNAAPSSTPSTGAFTTGTGSNPVTPRALEAVSDGVNGTPRIAAETRPTNANVNYIIKV